MCEAECSMVGLVVIFGGVKGASNTKVDVIRNYVPCKY
jgi:hypothetical protein